MRLIKHRSSVIDEIIVAAGLSLAINYMITYLLSAFSWFSLGWYVGFAGVSIVGMGILLVRDMRKSHEIIVHDLWVIAGGIGMLVFLWVLNQFVARSGSVPWAGDDLFGWNEWALRWFHRDPVWSQSNFYPQMLPITWAVSYLWSGTEGIYFFSRSIMPFFFFGILGMGWNLWWKKRDIPSFMGMIFLLWLFVVWKDFPRMTMGIADIPAAFFAFASFVVLLEGLDDERWQGIVLAAILATMASLTKQYGLLYLGAFGVIVFILFVRKKWWKDVLWWRVVLFIGLFAAVWLGLWYGVGFFREGYAFKNTEALVTRGAFEAYQASSESTQRFSLSRGWKQAVELLSRHFRSGWMVLVVGIGWAISLVSWPWLLFGWLVVVPAFLAWMLLIAYDIRNVSIGLVFFIYLAGIGWGTVLRMIRRKDKNPLPILMKLDERIQGLVGLLGQRFWIPLLVLGLGGALVGGWSVWYSYERLERIQEERMKKYVGNYRDLNAMVYDCLGDEKDVPIYGEYAFLAFFPYVLYNKIDFRSLESVRNVIESGRKGYLLWVVSSSPSDEVLSYLEASEKAGRIHRVGQCDSGTMWRLSGKDKKE